MLVQNVQTNSVFASGIFSISGEKIAAKAENSIAFSDMLKCMNMSDSSLNPAKVNLKVADNGQGNDAKTVSVVDAKQSIRNIKGKDTTDALNADGKANVAQNAEEFDEAEFEKVSACLVNIVVTVVEFFNITPEELQVKLDGLGMNASDLADPDALKQLFVAFDCNDDISQLLTDQNLLSSFEDLVNEVTGILEEFGVDDEMISKVITESFGDESNFKIDLLGKNETVDVKPDAKLHEVKEDNVLVETTGVAEDTEEKKITLEFSREGENKGDSRSDKKKNDGPAQDATSLADRFVNNMVTKFQQTVGEAMGIDKAVSNLRGIADQILNQIKINLTPETTSLEIQLTPEHLGKVNVQIQENDGVISAKFHTENQVSKEAIESNIIQFKETLREQGLKVDSVEVTVSDFSFAKDQDAERNGAEQNGGRNKRHFSLDEINEKVDGPDLKAQSYIDDGTSTVSYVA